MAAELTLKLEKVTARLVQGKYARAIFVANNPLILPAAVPLLALQKDDILVQFNRAGMFDLFAAQACHKTHVFNANSQGSYWGFSPEGVPERDYVAQAQGEFSVYFIGWLSKPARAYLEVLTGAAMGGLIPYQKTAGYPAYPAGATPTAGFIVMNYYRSINILRRFHGKPQIKLVLLGFRGKPSPAAAWGRHDYVFEQKTYDIWPDLIRLDEAGGEAGGATPVPEKTEKP